MPVIRFEPLMAARPSRACSPGTGMPAFSIAVAGRHALALVEALALAHQRERDLAHRREVAARADAALLADDRA